jgi:regulator of protease activity HflC (stomatin/prohibitin superfamily)
MSWLIIILLLFLLILLLTAIKIVPEYERIVILRLGRALKEAKGPGLVLVIPIIDYPIRVDLRERVFEIAEQSCITKDNALIKVDFLIYLRIIDPVLSVVSVENLYLATQGLATTTLRAIIGDIILDDVLSKREEINQKLQMRIDEVTQRWGVKVTTVEIREIIPPREIQEAMTKQMAAERNRRAMITEAEGVKQSQILKAEGEKQSQILKAEGERQAQILRAEGYALALSKIYEVAKNIDPNTIALEYLKALENISNSSSTKIIFPLELSNIISEILNKVKK